MTVAETAGRMLDTYPRDFNVDQAELVRCIDACVACAQACTQCADDCLSEDGRQEQLTKCMRLNLDCADICSTTARVISRQTDYDANVTRGILEACSVACRSCADECGVHAGHGMKHCAVCAEACWDCDAACRVLLDKVS